MADPANRPPVVSRRRSQRNSGFGVDQHDTVGTSTSAKRWGIFTEDNLIKNVQIVLLVTTIVHRFKQSISQHVPLQNKCQEKFYLRCLVAYVCKFYEAIFLWKISCDKVILMLSFFIMLFAHCINYKIKNDCMYFFQKFKQFKGEVRLDFSGGVS